MACHDQTTIARRYGHAVAPTGIAAQTIANRQAVGTDAAVGLSRNCCGKHRDRIAARIGGEERLKHESVDKNFNVSYRRAAG